VNETYKEGMKKVVDSVRRHDRDTGSSEVQIAALTERIEHLNKHHFPQNKKDFAGQRGLLRLVNRRRDLLEYLKKHDPVKRFEILERLGIRK